MNILSGVTAVATSGTAVQLNNTEKLVLRLYLSAPIGNTGSVFFGDSTVEGSGTVSGLEIKKGTVDSVPVPLDFEPRRGRGGVQFKDMYVDAANNGDDLMWVAVIQ